MIRRVGDNIEACIYDCLAALDRCAEYREIRPLGLIGCQNDFLVDDLDVGILDVVFDVGIDVIVVIAAVFLLAGIGDTQVIEVIADSDQLDIFRLADDAVISAESGILRICGERIQHELSVRTGTELSLPEIRLERIRIQTKADKVIALIHLNRTLCDIKCQIRFCFLLFLHRNLDRGSCVCHDLFDGWRSTIIRKHDILLGRICMRLCHLFFVPLGMCDEKSGEGC